MRQFGRIVGWGVFSLGCALVLIGLGSGLNAMSEIDMLGSIWYVLTGLAFAVLSKIVIDAVGDKEG